MRPAIFMTQTHLSVKKHPLRQKALQSAAQITLTVMKEVPDQVTW